MLVEWLGALVGSAAPVKLGRLPFSGGSADQRELADYERGAADIYEAAVELPMLVLEDTEPGDLGGEPVRVGGSCRLAATPTRTTSPGPISPFVSPATVTRHATLVGRRPASPRIITSMRRLTAGSCAPPHLF